jgi:two-component system NarL family response regulator
MPGTDGIAALEEILAANPNAKVVMLTTSGTDEDIYRSLEIGAKGYVLKTEAADDIVAAIRTVAGGDRYIPEPVRVIYERRAASPTFSDKEIDTLRLVSEGKQNREISEALEVSEITVKVRLSSVFAKLGARDRVDAVNRAVERGLIPPRA